MWILSAGDTEFQFAYGVAPGETLITIPRF